MYCPKCKTEVVQSSHECLICDATMLQEKPKPLKTKPKAKPKTKSTIKRKL